MYFFVFKDDEDDRSTNTWILEEQIIKLKKENDDLRKENELLKNKLFSSPNLEKENVDLRKEVESLRRENRSLSVSANSLVARLERLVFDGNVNATEEWSVENGKPNKSYHLPLMHSCIILATV